MRLYRELASWYHLLDPPEDHAEGAVFYQAALERRGSPPMGTLLELGAGAGNNVLHLKQRYLCTVTDLSPEMLNRSRTQNPECAHTIGDMRSLRLGQTFDAVLVHDAIVYMTTEVELHAVATTAFVHTRPGGAALFGPDYLRETFRPGTDLITGDEGQRSLRCIEWTWDPDPRDDTYVVDYAFLLREGQKVTSVHDRHVEGLFALATWVDVLSRAGFDVEPMVRRLSEGRDDTIFACGRPA